jgi:hypothetical protein
MKSIRRFALPKVLLLAVAAMSTSAIPAHAQNTSGTFSLAHKVLWAGAVLPPGDYAFSLDTQSSPARISVRHVDGPMVGIILPQTISADDFVGGSSLTLHHEGGESVVSTLHLKNVGLALEFASPKAIPAETAGLGPIADPQSAK